MTHQNICTPQELIEFANSMKLTINDFSEFIENKTNQVHVIVQKEFVQAISKQLFANTMHIFDMNRVFTETWEKIIRTNQDTTKKWEEQLKIFET